MAEPDRCMNCLYFLPGATAAKMWADAGGMCRRYAPQGPIAMGREGSWQAFPPMGPNQWCGDYRSLDAVAVERKAAA